MFKVTEDIFYIGVDDTDIDLFEGQYAVPNGVSYNSYICKDKKIAVFDTVDSRKTAQWLENLETALNGKQPDYLIISHMEPDHASSIPAFLDRYPSASVVGNEKTFIIAERFFRDAKFKKLTVKDGDKLDLGKHRITFHFAPMVHWPEVMFSYDEADKVLFTADAFGKFGALSHKEDWLDEARRYYINIVGKYGLSVQAILKKVGALDVKTICPLHGPVLKDDISHYVGTYSRWSSYTPEEDGVFSAYASIYGNTEKAAKETGLVAGIPVVAGCSDAMASMHATGMSRLGEAGESSGTTSLVFVGSDKKSAPDIPVVTKPCAIDGMPWIFDAPIQTSGAALKWFIETMAAEERAYAEAHDKNIYTYLNELALESKAGSNGLFFFPYLLGERAPLWNEYARGMFIGMGMDMKRSDLVRSVFEGTAYALRHVMETVKESGAKAKILRICGGGAKSRTWCQIKASMLKMPVYILDEKSGDVPVGDALIVGHKVGVFEDLSKAAERIVKVNSIVQPVDEWV